MRRSAQGYRVSSCQSLFLPGIYSHTILAAAIDEVTKILHWRQGHNLTRLGGANAGKQIW